MAVQTWRNSKQKNKTGRLARLKITTIMFVFSCMTAFISSSLFSKNKNQEVVVGKLMDKTADSNLISKEVVVNPCSVVFLECENNINGVEESALWTFFYSAAILYVFLGLAIVCDDFFVASLEVICKELDLTPDVAGATFMAAGSSAPELFTSVVGVFYAKSDVGVGTILGSAVFNILVIIGLTAVLAGQVLHLDWRPFARDSLYYILSIFLMLVMFSNRRIDWYESILLLFAYVFYLVCMKYNGDVMNFMERAALLFTSNSVYSPPKVEEKKAEETKESEPENDEPTFPEGAKDQLMWILSIPFVILFRYTIPDCSVEKYRKYYLVSFFMSVFWIGALCFFMVDWARALGCILDVDPHIMGLTVLAAGTSVPDALSSLLVAQDGEGDMAVSNAIGSNVFDILVGLGLPWTLSNIINNGEPVPVCSNDILLSTVILFIVLIFVIMTLVLSDWKLSPRVGGAMFALYFVFLGYCIYDAYIGF